MTAIMRRWLAPALVAAMTASAAIAAAQEPVRLHAAGSLRAALTDVTDAFTRGTGLRVEAAYGPSGLLRDRLDKGEPGGVFASANMEHPQSLAKAGKATAAALFARNRLCALVGPKIDATSDTLLDRMLDDAVKLGTSTPKADPSGDYAWALFTKAETLRPGSRARLEAKALQLVGGPNSPPAPAGRSAYGALAEAGTADIFLTYCTNARLAATEVPSLKVVAIPEPLAVGADYGLTLMSGAGMAGARLALYILSPAGQAILARHGFTAPGLPAGES